MEKKSKQPRGFRNNNPLNIRQGISRWQGRTIMQDDPDFVTFIDMNMGYRAAWKLMDTYRLRLAKEGKSYNLHNILHRWAPTDENDTSHYIQTVLTLVKNLGGMESLPAPSTLQGATIMARILAAMTCVECGVSKNRVPTQAIIEGYKLAFPGADVPTLKW